VSKYIFAQLLLLRVEVDGNDFFLLCLTRQRAQHRKPLEIADAWRGQFELQRELAGARHRLPTWLCQSFKNACAADEVPAYPRRKHSGAAAAAAKDGEAWHLMLHSLRIACSERVIYEGESNPAG
jgi:hypothetical protein